VASGAAAWQSNGPDRLIVAAREGCLPLSPELVNREGDINHRTAFVMTALDVACVSGSLGVIGTLLEKGEKVNGKDRYGTTPLIRASRRGSAEPARMLLDRGQMATAKTCLAGPLSFGPVSRAEAI
jgi:ankyrin repeat protein